MKSLQLKAIEWMFLIIIAMSTIFFGSVYSWTLMGVAMILFAMLFMNPNSLYEIRYLPKAFLVLISIVFLWIFAQTFLFAVNQYESVQQLIKWTAVAVGFLMILTLPASAIVRLMLAIVLLGFVQVLYGLFQVISGSELVLWAQKKGHWGYVTGTYFNRNNLAGLLELSLGLNFGFLLRAFWKNHKQEILLFSILLFVTGFGLLQTGSRVGIVSFPIAFVLLCFFLSFHFKAQSLLFLFSIIVVGGVAAILASDILLYRFEQLAEQLPTLDGRIIAWQNVFHMIQERGSTGLGLGNFSWGFPLYQSEKLALTWDHAHNDYLELAAELGPIFAIILFFAFLRLLSWILYRLMSVNEEFFPLVWGGMIGVFSLCLHSLTDFNLAIPANASILVWSLAMLLRLLKLSHHGETISHSHHSINKTFKLGVTTFARGLAVLLIFFSTTKVWAGTHLYQGQYAFGQNRYEEALQHFKKIKGDESLNPDLIGLAGAATWELGIETKDPKWYELGITHYNKLIGVVPQYSRAWLGLGLSKLYSYSLNNEKELTKDQIQEVYATLEKARSLEPNGSWIAYMIGIHLLAHVDQLDVRQKEESIFLLRKGLKHASPANISGAIDFLWTNNKNWQLLKSVIPSSYDAYKVFVEFLQKNNLWEPLSEAYPVYFKLQEVSYSHYTDQGERFLNDGEYRRAHTAFQRAYWIDQSKVRALLGMLIAQDYIGRLDAEYRQKLVSVFEEEDENIGKLLPLAEELVYLAKDPYLVGLLEYRLGNYKKAREWFGKIEIRSRAHRRYLAKSYYEEGVIPDAIQTLQPILEESNPDLRDLLLLKNWNTVYQEQVLAKIAAVTTTQRQASQWQSRDFKDQVMDHRGKMGMVLNLIPGKREIQFQVKGIPGVYGNHGILLCRIQGSIFATAFVTEKEWQTISLPLQTAGGRRWFEVELINGKIATAKERGPMVVLGDVEIR